MRIFEPYHMPCQIGLSKPQVFQYCYCLDAQTETYTQQTDCFTWTANVVRKNKRTKKACTV